MRKTVKHFESSAILISFLVACASLTQMATAATATFKTIHSFCSSKHHACSDGQNPGGPLIRDPGTGVLYGTTGFGGRDNGGTVFEIGVGDNGRFKLTSIHSFGPRGTAPQGPLIEDTNGNLYGTTFIGGRYAQGGVFELSFVAGKTGSHWVAKVLYSFCRLFQCSDGQVPSSGLTFAGQIDGNLYDGVSPLYGTTQAGGANGGGTVYKLELKNGKYRESVLYSFCAQQGTVCTDGSLPKNGIVLDASGNFFGTTMYGGKAGIGQLGAGTVFELAANGGTYRESVLYDFCSLSGCRDGAFPAGPISIDSSGTIYSATGTGGRSCHENSWGCGTIFKLTPNGGSYAETVLYAFCKRANCADGWEPTSVVMDISGRLLGTTFFGGDYDIDKSGEGGGTAFEISNGTFETLHKFCSRPACADGEYLSSPLLLDDKGNALGTTDGGGVYSGGTIFELTY